MLLKGRDILFSFEQKFVCPMKVFKKLINLLKKKNPKTAPLLIIKKDSYSNNVKEYNSIEEAIMDLENDPNVLPDKIEKLKEALKNLKQKTTIKIINGEIIK